MKRTNFHLFIHTYMRLFSAQHLILRMRKQGKGGDLLVTRASEKPRLMLSQRSSTVDYVLPPAIYVTFKEREVVSLL